MVTGNVCPRLARKRKSVNSLATGFQPGAPQHQMSAWSKTELRNSGEKKPGAMFNQFQIIAAIDAGEAAER
jgi:hypothetical protein